MRGGYTAGVLDAFIEEGVAFDYCIGVSAGACNALSYIGKQKGRYIRANTDYLRDPRYMGLRSMLKTGHFLGNRFIFDDITNELVPLDFEAFARETPYCPFTVVTTDCFTGKARYDVISDLHEQWRLVEASSSLPLISPAVAYEGTMLMDGGVSDSIPIRRAPGRRLYPFSRGSHAACRLPQKEKPRAGNAPYRLRKEVPPIG